MVADKSMKVSREAKLFLDNLKKDKRETYDDVILRLKSKSRKNIKHERRNIKK